MAFEGQPTQALVLLDDAILLNPDNITAWHAQALCLLIQGKYADSVETFSQCIAVLSDKEEALQYRAFGHLQLGMLDAARADAQEAVDLGRRNGRAYAILGKIEQESGHFEIALTNLDRAIGLLDTDLPLHKLLDIDHAGIHNSRGTILSQLNRHRDAIAAYTSAIELAPTEPVFLMNRGALYVDDGAFDAGIDDFTWAIEFEPNSATLYQIRANAYRLRGDTLKSQNDIEKAGELWDAQSDSQIDGNVRQLLPRKEWEPGIPEGDLRHL